MRYEFVTLSNFFNLWFCQAENLIAGLHNRLR